MSWLRDHFYQFVFPAFVASGKPTDQIGEPFDVRASNHAPARLPSELQKLWTLCKEHNVPWSFDIRENNAHGGHSKYRESAKIHYQVMRDTLASAQAALRHEGCDRIFLGGRDVWALAVLAERRRIPYLFVPELSRPVCDRPEVKEFLASRGFRGTELFLDTGFAGSIPRSLAKWYGEVPFKFRLMSQSETSSFTQQQQLDAMKGKAPPGFKFEMGKDQENGLPTIELTKDPAAHPTAEEIAEFKEIWTKLKMHQVADPKHQLVTKGGLYDCDPMSPKSFGKTRQLVEKYKKRPNQVFPNFKEARERALEAEYLAKYWTRGRYDTGEDAYTGFLLWPVNEAYLHFREKPNLRRWSEPQTRCFGITDGVESALVSISDIKVCPPFEGWWKTLPEGPRPIPPKREGRIGRIMQTFASKAEIQRAALLTSMLWRGIPYWKLRTEPDRPVTKFHQGQGQAVYNASNLSQLQMVNSTVNTISSASSFTTTNHVIMNPITFGTGTQVATVYVGDSIFPGIPNGANTV